MWRPGADGKSSPWRAAFYLALPGTLSRALIGHSPVIVGGLAVMCRLSSPYRATTDLDVVDRLLGETPQLQVLRAAPGAKPVEPTSVLLPTVYGQVKVDVLEVRQIEIDQPSHDPGDRLHAFAHAWASDTATEVTMPGGFV